MRTARISPDLPELPVISLGIDAFGTTVDEARAFALLDAFVAGGGTLIDTAHVYGAGASERCLGRWLAARGNRSHVVIATKGAHPPVAAMHRSRLAAADLRQDLDESLERLHTDRIDLYWLHRDDPAIAIESILTALEDLRRSGMIRAYGASNWTLERLADAASCAARLGIVGFCAASPAWSYARRDPGAPTWPGCRYADANDRAWHQRSGLAMIPWSAQARGWFAKDVAEYDFADNRQRRDLARTIGAARGVSANQIALAWLTHQAFPVIATVGAHRLEQLADSLAAGAVALTPDEMALLDSVA